MLKQDAQKGIAKMDRVILNKLMEILIGVSGRMENDMVKVIIAVILAPTIEEIGRTTK